jgi:hypothetical protein
MMCKVSLLEVFGEWEVRHFFCYNPSSIAYAWKLEITLCSTIKFFCVVWDRELVCPL